MQAGEREMLGLIIAVGLVFAIAVMTAIVRILMAIAKYWEAKATRMEDFGDK